MGFLTRMVRAKLGSSAVLSTFIAAMCWGGSALAHEVRPAVADVRVGTERVEIVLTVAVEPMVAGIDLDGLSDTNESPLAAEYDRLRALAPADLEAALRAAWPDLRSGVRIESAGMRPEVEIVAVEVGEVGDLELPRDTILTFGADLPDGDAPVTLAWKPAYGPIVVREMSDADNAYTGFLTGGTPSAPLPRQSAGFFGGLFGGN